MTLTNDEKTLLLLYYEDSRKQTLDNLLAMRKELQPDDRELFSLTSCVIRKLEKMTEQEFLDLDLFAEAR